MLDYSIEGHKHLLTMFLNVFFTLKLNVKINEAYESINNSLSIEQYNIGKLIFLRQKIQYVII